MYKLRVLKLEFIYFILVFKFNKKKTLFQSLEVFSNIKQKTFHNILSLDLTSYN